MLIHLFRFFLNYKLITIDVKKLDWMTNKSFDF